MRSVSVWSRNLSRGSTPHGRICGFRGEQVATEGCDANGGYCNAPDREEKPAGIGKKGIAHHDSRSSGARGHRKAASRRRDELSVLSRELRDGLLLRGSRSFLVHALLHARFVIGFHLLELGFLVLGQQLVKLIVGASLLYSKSGLNLCLLRG